MSASKTVLEGEIFEVSKSKLSALTLRVWMYLRAEIKPGHWKAIPLSEIASHLGATIPKISKAISLLVDEGLVMKKPVDSHLRRNVSDKMFGIPGKGGE